MANRQHVKILSKGVQVWNQWRKEKPKICPDLKSIDLSGQELQGIYLDGCDLSYSNLQKTQLMEAWLAESSLKNANLNQANLAEAHLEEANLSEATLVGSCLENSWLNDTNFSRANLSSANLIGAKLYRTNFQNAILEHSILSLSQPIGANFLCAKMTGSVLQDWYPNPKTILKDIDCKFFYLETQISVRDPRKLDFTKKFPQDRILDDGEFTKIFQAPKLSFETKMHYLENAVSEFQELLEKYPSGNEHIFHEFLQKNPSLLDIYGTVKSKPRFYYPDGESGHNGKIYVEPDFIITYPENSYKLVEIEKPDKSLNTKQGHQTSQFTQAAWQLNEWDAFIKQYPHTLKKDYPGIALRRSSLLVIGHSNDKEKKSMLSNNCPHGEVYTFDDLLERAKSVLNNLKIIF